MDLAVTKETQSSAHFRREAFETFEKLAHREGLPHLDFWLRAAIAFQRAAVSCLPRDLRLARARRRAISEALMNARGTEAHARFTCMT
jgi:hypothetical protein